MWKILQACVEADVIVITQAANTGLTGGSTPDGNDYDRDIVIVNTMRMNIIQTINNNEQVVCLPGSTLNQLELLLKPLGREPHSVIGSSCIGASVLGGVCNNSGGALVQRGPAYTEMALFAQINEEGKLELVNHLGIDLGDTPEEILTNLQGHHYQKKTSRKTQAKDTTTPIATMSAKWTSRPPRVSCRPGAPLRSVRLRGQTDGFAVRLDTFPQEKQTAVFYIGTNDINELTDIRRAALGGI